MKKWLIRVAILVALIVLFIVLKATVFAPDPLEVEVVEVERGRVEETITNTRAGTVTARRRASLSPEVGGQIVKLPFREGDRVEEGDVVLELESSSQRAQLTLSQRDLEAARAEQNRACLAAERAQRESERFARLADDKIVSVDLLDAAESAYATSTAACQASKAQTARAAAALDLARTQLSKTILRAPFGGIVADLQVELGEWTTPSPPAMPVPPVIDLLDPGSVYISAPMDEVDSAKVQVGQPARITVDSHRDREFMGRVVRRAPYVLDLQEQNRTLEIEVELDDQEFASTLLPGTSADVEIILAADDDVLRIPTAALIEGGKVLVLEAGVLDERELEIGRRNWNFTEVVDGVAEGDRVVVSLDSEDIQDGAEAVASGDGDGGRGNGEDAAE